MFESAGEYHYVPSSPIGSMFSTDCVCNMVGGFEGRANGLIGCTPCKDGWFSTKGNSSCSICPLGTYSAATSTTNLFSCNTSNSPRLLFNSIDVTATFTPSNCTMIRGATECTPCSADYPYTHDAGSTSSAACTKCPKDNFFSNGVCQACTPTCDKTISFEIESCSAIGNRFCQFCDRTKCQSGDYITDCPGDYSLNGFPNRGCKKCINKPENSTFPGVAAQGADENTCPWVCDQGFYSVAGIAKCNPCTVFNGTTCNAGMVFSPCNSTLQKDSSCSMPCAATSKPLLNSKWLKGSMIPGTNTSVINPDMLIPNTACMWECNSGYMRIITTTGIVLCTLIPS
jgi:hypothetical protein